MIIQKKPDYLIFADSAKKGEVTDFPDVSRGWGVTIEQTGSKPPLEWMNGAFNRIDKNMLYLLQQGIPEWSESVIYPVNAIIKHKGVLYIALAENDNAKPASNTSKWQRLQADYFNALPAQKITKGNDPIYEVGEQVDFKKLAINGHQISRFIVANGSNVNGWYEIYSDGFKRVGNKWPAANPLYSPNPSGCVKIPFPISFTRAVMSVNVSIETTTPAVEIINYEISGLHEIGLTAGMYGVSGMVGMSEFACSYIAEGY